ncbi:MAG: MarR family transcriptional regulator [Erysipelotrichaceae bacterium]|nr:MarR family transcriptional regulator [Erysipelotrichaceae bacterium]
MRHFIDETNGPACEERRHHPLRRHCHRHGMHHPFMRDRNDLEGMYMAVARMMGHEVRRRFGMSQDRIIAILKENGGTMSQRTLQRLLDIKPGSISEILSKMEEKGLIERSKDDEDKRASLITLISEEEAMEERPSFFEMLSEEEKESLKAILNKILDSRKEKFENQENE